MGFSLTRALGFLAAPLTGGASLAMAETKYQTDKAQKKAEDAQAAIIQAEEDLKQEAKKSTGRKIMAQKQAARSGSLLGSGYLPTDTSKTLLGQ